MNGSIFFFSALGVFNGILLSLYLLVFTKQKSLSKNLLGFLVLALSIRIGKSILLYFNPALPKIYLQIGLSACLFIGPLLYCYLIAVIEKIKIFPSKWKLTLGSLLSIILIVGSIKPYHTDPDFWNAYVVHGIYTIWFLSVCAAGILLFTHLIKNYKSSYKLSSLEKWLLAVYLGNLIIATAFFTAFFGNSMAYYITGPMVFTFFLYLLTFGYFNDQWFDISDKPQTEKYQNKKIEEKEAQRLLQELQHLMEKESIYKDPNLKLKQVAERLYISSHQLSQLLNDNLGKSFKPLINEYRINLACKLLGTNHQLSLEGVGYEVGFKSKSTFFTTFKKVKDLTPAQYQRQVSNKTS